MKVKTFLILLSLAVAAGALACVEEDDEDVLIKAATWEQIARSVDYQTGAIALDENNPICRDDATIIPVTYGTHCKNRLRAQVSLGMVLQYVRTMVDCPWDNCVNEDWRPLADDLCNADLDASGTPDIYEVCAAGVLSCQDKKAGRFALSYNNCQFDDVGSSFLINGAIYINSYLTRQGESVVILNYDNFSVVDGATYGLRLNGSEVIYKVIDPFNGDQAVGTTGAPNGMTIYKMKRRVNNNGAGSVYSVHYAVDEEEDGPLFMTADSRIAYLESPVWPFMMLGADLTFFEKGLPWNGAAGSGCSVRVQNLNTTARTVDILGPSVFNGDACIKDALNVSF